MRVIHASVPYNSSLCACGWWGREGNHWCPEVLRRERERMEWDQALGWSLMGYTAKEWAHWHHREQLDARGRAIHSMFFSVEAVVAQYTVLPW